LIEGTFRNRLDAFEDAVRGVSAVTIEGRVLSASGLTVDVAGIARHASLGDRVALIGRSGIEIPAEIVSFGRGLARAMPFEALGDIGPGCRARVGHGATGSALPVDPAWLGRVVDPLGRPLDGRGPLRRGQPRALRAGPPDATRRDRLGAPLALGVRVLDLFTTMRRGQRLGLFAGSGVGKSSLLSMLARGADCDVAVIALVGERGREVREFIEDDLGEAGLARSVVVVATSDMQPIMRRQAGYAAMTIAETFRDQGQSVLLMMDSVTRFCLAAREIGLSAGEPPATRGYPPSVFAELPRLLERAGPGVRDAASIPAGSITGLFTVLVEGDDHNEPVADAVRGILDGHVVMDRAIGEAGRYPAVDVVRSLSRAGGCLAADDNELIRAARAILSRWGEMAELVRLGAYKAGSDPATDRAVAIGPRIEAMLRQGRDERTSIEDSLVMLRGLLSADRET
jgi:flagellum-specific ATP synthase